MGSRVAGEAGCHRYTLPIGESTVIKDDEEPHRQNEEGEVGRRANTAPEQAEHPLRAQSRKRESMMALPLFPWRTC